MTRWINKQWMDRQEDTSIHRNKDTYTDTVNNSGYQKVTKHCFCILVIKSDCVFLLKQPKINSINSQPRLNFQKDLHETKESQINIVDFRIR